MNLKFLPKFMRPQDTSDDDEMSESENGSVSEEETYDDCLSDGDRSSEKKRELSAIQKSVESAPGSIATEASCNMKEGCFVDVDSDDDFVQTDLFKSDYLQKIPTFVSTPSKGSTVYKKTSVYPPLGSIATEVSVASTDGEGSFIHVEAADNFAQTTSIPLKSLDLRKISTQSKGSTAYKNDLQTLCQRKRVKLPTYTHVMEGPAHAPKFQASVQVGEDAYHSDRNFNSKGEAEQAAAKEALSILDQLDITSTLKVTSSQPNVGSLNASACTGDSDVRLKNVKLEGQLGTSLTIETAIDLTETEQSLGSSPPLSTLSSPACNTRALSAARSYQQLWGGHRDSNTFKDLLQKKKPTALDTVAALAGLDNTVRGIAGQFSGLQVNGSIPDRVSARQAREPHSVQQSVKWPTQTEHLEALGRLKFATHAFPILARLNRLPLEEVYTVGEIEGLQNLSADAVHPYLSDLDRVHRRGTTSLPPPKIQTDPELLSYECQINSKGECLFKASPNRQGSTVLQRTLGFDKVLQVFLEECFEFDVYKDILKHGIFAGPRVYHYFVHKGDDDNKSEDEEHRNTQGTVKCYFVCTDSKGENDLNDKRFRNFNTIAEVRSLFMHVHTLPTVSKYIARLQLCLTKTMTITDISFSHLNIDEMEDLPSKDKANAKALFTDGTGFISTDLSRLMPTSIFKGLESDEGLKNELREDYPSLLQVRFFQNGAAYKGTLLANKALPNNTIKFYKSMKKIECDPRMSKSSISSFELVSTSRCPRRAKLSRDLIVLLSIGGVHESIFLEALKRASEQVLAILRDRKRAHEELQWEGGNEMAETTRHMLRAGIPMEEPGLQQNLIHLIKNKFKDFAVGKVPLDGTFYLMGTADPTGTLKPNEVVIFEGGRLVFGPVLLYRAPGKHPGDPHKADAVYSKALQEIVGGEKNVIFFSTQGSRPLQDEIGKGDLDGDLYWICENPKVVKQFTEWVPRWSPGPVNSRAGKGQDSPQVSQAVLEDALLDVYLNERFSKSKVVGAASMRWLTHADAYLHPDTSSKDRDIHWKELMKYPDYIYEAIDSAKSGKQLTLFPEHSLLRKYKAPYLWRYPQNVEVGTGVGRSILGKIYDLGTAQEARMGPSFCRDHYKVDPAFIVPGSAKYIEKWNGNYKRYRQDMARACAKKEDDPEGPNRVNKSWKMVLYGAPSFKERTEERQQIIEEASAIYQFVYRTAQQDCDVGNAKIAFVWNVAGVALSSIYADSQPKESIVYSGSAYNEIHKRSKGSASASRRAF